MKAGHRPRPPFAACVLAATMPLLLASAPALAQGGETITVNTSDDVVDFGGAQRVADLPGPDGKVSLAEANIASDNTPGVQTIGFAVPKSEWLYQAFFPGRAVLRPFSGLRLFQPAIVDATTQTLFTGDTYPDGGEVVIWAPVYIIDSVGSEVRGFDSLSLGVSGGSHNKVQGNSNSSIEVFDSGFNLIGGTAPGEGNTGGTIKIDRASNNLVYGNTVTRVRVLGWYGGGQPAIANRIGGPGEGERNYITGYGTWDEHGAPGGTTVQIFDAQGTIVENNWIGTTPDGMEQGSLASTTGIGFEGENHDTVIRNNRIAGILGHGIDHWSGFLFGSDISIYGEGSGITIQGNTIGLNAAGEPLLGSVTGIATYDYYLGVPQGVVIGGAGPGQGNEIAGQVVSGIVIASPYSGVTISGNSIHDNKELGIDLVAQGFVYGVTPNDSGDFDTGGNGLQNFPVLATALISGGTTAVAGALDSTASRTFTVEFFASPTCDPSGYGQGSRYLGSAVVTTNGAGHAEFRASVLAAGGGDAITSTATDQSTGDTSEFSACVTATGGTECRPDCNKDGRLNINDFICFQNEWQRRTAYGDYNGDGKWNINDFIAFQSEFARGCL